MSNDLVVYGLKGSPFVRKVLIALAEKGLAYDFETVSPFPAPDWYKEISPLNRIPAFRDRAVGTEGKAGTLADSSAILAYLDRKFEATPLIPADAFEAGRALWFEEYADSMMAATIGLGMFRPIIFNRMQGKDPDIATARETMETKCPAFFDYLEAELEGEFLVGSAFSIADVSIVCQLINFRFAGGVIDAARWPKLAAYFDAMLQRPSVKGAYDEEAAMFPPVDLAA